MPHFKDLALSYFNDYPVPISILASLIVLYVLAKLFKRGGSEEKTETKKPSKKGAAKKEK